MRRHPLSLGLLVLSLLPSFAAGAIDGSCPSGDAPALAGLSELTTAVAAAPGVPAPVARLVFERAGWAERVEDAMGGPGVLFGGTEAQLAISPDRFPGCAGPITGYVRDAGGQITVVPMDGVSDGMRTGRFVAGAAGPIEVWFRSYRPAYGNQPGCELYDSDLGRNYSFTVHPYETARATFAAGGEWAPALDGAVRRGGALVVEYDPARLPQCRTSYLGNPTWSIIAHLRFDDGREAARNVAGTIPYAGGPVAFAIPEDATGAELWFENVGHYPGDPTPCRAWDSAHGANYRLPIED